VKGGRERSRSIPCDASRIEVVVPFGTNDCSRQGLHPERYGDRDPIRRLGAARRRHPRMRRAVPVRLGIVAKAQIELLRRARHDLDRERLEVSGRNGTTIRTFGCER
jgi:hypothetical protein